MIITLHQPDGVHIVNTRTVSDSEWVDLGLPLSLLEQYRLADNLADEFNDKRHQVLEAYLDWQHLNPAEKDRVLKNLLGYLLWKEGLL